MTQKIRQKLSTVGLTYDEFFVAGVSFASCPYKWAMPGSVAGEVVPATGASLGAPIGIVQNAPAAGAQARVRMLGKSLTAACMGASNLAFGTLVSVGSHGGTIPSVCGMAFARWAGSTMLSGASTAYGEVFVYPIGACVPGAS